MNLAISKTRSSIGIHARTVFVEVHLSNGLPNFTIVGLPETAVKESKDRVRSAIINSHFEFPCRRITVNLAPANVPKTGSGFDLPIAIGILAASHQIPADKLINHEFIGELALSGKLRGVASIIPVILATHHDNQQLIISAGNAEEASLTGYMHVHIADNLIEVCTYMCNNTPLQRPAAQPQCIDIEDSLDWSDIKGQYHAKNAMEIAAAGGHSLLLSGPPGSGKTMLAKRFRGLLPTLSEEQALECAAIHSIRGRPLAFHHWRQPTFRAPHHTASSVALVGGGNPPKPGEISLAHNGVLFLDELPEFHRSVLETLREPLESGEICISRAATQVDFPARFQLLAAMNPCPCGQFGNPKATCICSPDRISRYLSKISAPFLDRIDMQINVNALTDIELLMPNTAETGESVRIRSRIKKIHEQQIQRQGCLNSRLSSKECERVLGLKNPSHVLLSNILQTLKFSARAFDRLLKVSRTIADMRCNDIVEDIDIKKALSFRQTLQRPK